MKAMTRTAVAATVVAGFALLVLPTAVRADTHSDLQAVDSDGNLTYYKVNADPEDPGNVVVLQGICLNNPEDMLDPASQWQIFVQGEGDDLAATAAWAGKFYQASAWEDELARLNGSGFREGDRVRITGFAMSTGGKANINERHSPAPQMNFTVELLDAGVGLPAPEMTTIAEMITFDQTRQIGGERYQCRRIRIDNVVLRGGDWGANQYLTIADADDPDNPARQMPLKLCNVDFGSQAPATWFHVVGLGDQEPTFGASGPIPGTGLVDGYQLWVTRRDGIIVPGDCNLDGAVNDADLSLLLNNWQQPGEWAQGEFDGDAPVSDADLSLMLSNWGFGCGGEPGGTPPVPEPATIFLLASGALALRRKRK